MWNYCWGRACLNNCIACHINCCCELKIKFPITLEELHKSADEFHQCSGERVLNGCVAALDGWPCCIRVPSAQETSWVISYFSGYYQCHGLNVRATCNAICWFTSILILFPGGTGDSKAFYSSNVYDLVESIPDGFYVVADNESTLSCSLLITYSGKEKQSSEKDVLTFTSHGIGPQLWGMLGSINERKFKT